MTEAAWFAITAFILVCLFPLAVSWHCHNHRARTDALNAERARQSSRRGYSAYWHREYSGHVSLRRC
jgi:hypothetical protein